MPHCVAHVMIAQLPKPPVDNIFLEDEQLALMLQVQLHTEHSM